MDIMIQSRDIGELNPLAQQACNLFLSECKAQGVDIFVTETYRSQARQNQLYAQGRTTAGDIVTWTKTSNHTGRMAWDIACKGNVLYADDILSKAGKIAKTLGITWGGTWKVQDRVHYEIHKEWVMRKEIKMRYNTLEEIPDWGKEAIEKLIVSGKFSDKNRLDLSMDMIRMFVIMNR